MIMIENATLLGPSGYLKPIDTRILSPGKSMSWNALRGYCAPVNGNASEVARGGICNVHSRNSKPVAEVLKTHCDGGPLPVALCEGYLKMEVWRCLL